MEDVMNRETGIGSKSLVAIGLAKLLERRGRQSPLINLASIANPAASVMKRAVSCP